MRSLPESSSPGPPVRSDVEVPQEFSWWRPLREVFSAPAASDWVRQVAHVRHFLFDDMHDSIARAMADLGLDAVFPAIGHVRRWAWWALAPTMTQVALDLWLVQTARWAALKDDSLFAESVATFAPREGSRRDRAKLPILRIAASSYDTLPVNVTGVLGAVALPLNVLAVLYGTDAKPGRGWAKVTAFGLSVAVLNSGLTGMMMDATMHTDKALGRTLRAARPWIWLSTTAALLATTGHSISQGRWPKGSTPYALMVCLLPYYIGLRTRQHDRVARAAGILHDRAITYEFNRIGRELHEVVQPYKRAVAAAVSEPGLAEDDRADLIVLRATLEHIRELQARGIRAHVSLLPPASVLFRRMTVRKIPKPIIDVAALDGALRGEGPVIDRNHAEVATRLASTLIHNALQAYDARLDVMDRTLRVSVSLDADQTIRVEVEDGLPPLTTEQLTSEHGTLAHYRREVTEHLGGTFEQVPTPSGGKAIVATWRNHFTELIRGAGRNL